MARKVARYEDKDGNVHDTKREAEAADAHKDIEEWVIANATNTEGDDYEVTADVIAGNAADLLPLLRKYVRLSALEKEPSDG